MCLDTQVLVYADCAINQHPTANELAQIALSSAKTAINFGMSPKVAMLSYSTGTSGSGEDVQKVKEATTGFESRMSDDLDYNSHSLRKPVWCCFMSRQTL